MHGHSGKSAAPARIKLCGQDGLTCSGPRRQAASRLAPTTSPPARWRAYMAAAVRRQACCGALLIDIVGYSRPSPHDSFVTNRPQGAQESINHILWCLAAPTPRSPEAPPTPRKIILSHRIGPRRPVTALQALACRPAYAAGRVERVRRLATQQRGLASCRSSGVRVVGRHTPQHCSGLSMATARTSQSLLCLGSALSRRPCCAMAKLACRLRTSSLGRDRSCARVI
jgi:hypothetical protein